MSAAQLWLSLALLSSTLVVIRSVVSPEFVKCARCGEPSRTEKSKSTENSDFEVKIEKSLKNPVFPSKISFFTKKFSVQNLQYLF